MFLLIVNPVEIEDNKNALETNNGNESGSTVKGRRRRNKAKTFEACDVAHKSAQDAALSMVKQAEPGKVVGDAVDMSCKPSDEDMFCST
ncbi:hypothetical protein Droror1_Dr00001974 [Drosera rotundifolia]